MFCVGLPTFSMSTDDLRTTRSPAFVRNTRAHTRGSTSTVFMRHTAQSSSILLRAPRDAGYLSRQLVVIPPLLLTFLPQRCIVQVNEGEFKSAVDKKLDENREQIAL